MSYYVVTLVASEDNHPITPDVISRVEKFLSTRSIAVHKVKGEHKKWLSPGKALDVFLKAKLKRPDIKSLRVALNLDKIDFIITEADIRKKRLMIADMDSTIIEEEGLDEIAAAYNVGDQVKEITRQSMTGRIDFAEALTQRVALLQDMPEDILLDVAAKSTYAKGAIPLMNTLKQAGIRTVLVTGGFDQIASHVAEGLGFSAYYCNYFEIKDGKLTGKTEGDILGPEGKLATLRKYTRMLSVPLNMTLCIGDGANDVDMLTTCQNSGGLAIGYHPKPVVRELMDNVIQYGTLKAVLYAMGYNDKEIINET